MVFTAIRMLFGDWVSWAVLAGVVATGAFFVNDYRQRGAQIGKLQSEAKHHRNALNVCKANVKQAQDEVKAAADARESFRVDMEKSCKVWNEIKDSETPVEDLLEKLKEDEAKKK